MGSMMTTKHNIVNYLGDIEKHMNISSKMDKFHRHYTNASVNEKCYMKVVIASKI